MIKIENANVTGFDAAIRGMRNPMNSWDKSDSGYCADMECDECPNKEYGKDICEGCDGCTFYNERVKDKCTKLFDSYIVGPNDYELMYKLAQAGSDHAKYRRMIVVYADILAPLYWWKEFDTYKVGTVANSCSTMHKIAEKEFTLDDFSHEHLDGLWIDCLVSTIRDLNSARKLYLETKNKDYWWQMIQLLPSSYNQRRTVTLNYEVLANIYHARKEHKLDEWRAFCDWITWLPYSDLITIK